jgi:NADPH-dependent glutamate synthase beta subunit-like oxidoreductase/CO/xanthine dehydrogenase FAD-binding subunit
MKNFNHLNARSFAEAAEGLKSTPQAVANAGGTDLMNILKERILPDHPELVVNLKSITDSSYISAEDETIRIGALTKLSDIVDSAIVQSELPALEQAAKSVATPIIRNAATIGGNICQDTRCWYYRYPHDIGGRVICARKGGHVCFAIQGRNKYHSVFGGMKVCATACSHDCPAGTDIPGYMEQLRLGHKENAARIIMQANPMPAITSRVCAHTCQDNCSRGTVDESVAIAHVERTLGDYIFANADIFYAPPAAESGKKVAIVGSGPAGLSAAFYLRKLGNAVTVYEKMPEAGGFLTYAIPAYRLPKNYVQTLVAALEKMGIKFVLNTTVGETITAEKLEEDFDKVFFATGAWKRPVLGFDGEEFTEFGLQFLIEVKQWIDKKVRKTVLVTGGGNVAMDVAVTAKRMGAEKVILACLESEPEMPASKEEIARAREEGVVIMPSYGISRALFQGNQVIGMELKRCVSVFNEQKRFDPQYDENEKTIVNADAILMAVGQKIDLDFLGDKYELAVKSGLIDVAEDTQLTSRPDVYAAGDATTGPSTVIMAIRGGRNAAKHINKEFGLRDFVKPREQFLSYDVEGAEKSAAAKLAERPAAERCLDKEDSYSLDWDAALEEAKRCLNCGCYSVNASDISPVLIALEAVIKTTERKIRAIDFFTTSPAIQDVLHKGELVTEVEIPKCDDYKSGYLKMRLRDSHDFAVTSLAFAYKIKDAVIKDARLVLGGVAPVPIRLFEVEKFLKGKEVDAALAEAAAELACKGAEPMKENNFKLQEIKVQVRNSLLNAK